MAKKRFVTQEQRETTARESNLLFSGIVGLAGLYMGAYVSSVTEGGLEVMEGLERVMDSLSHGAFLFPLSPHAFVSGLMFGALAALIAYFLLDLEYRRHFTYEQGDRKSVV